MFSSPVGGSPRGNEPDQNNINKTVEVTRKSDAPKSSLPKESRPQNRWNESLDRFLRLFGCSALRSKVGLVLQ